MTQNTNIVCKLGPSMHIKTQLSTIFRENLNYQRWQKRYKFNLVTRNGKKIVWPQFHKQIF